MKVTANLNNAKAATVGQQVLYRQADGTIAAGTILALIGDGLARVSGHGVPVRVANCILFSDAHAASTSNLIL